jgi:hypothetical protein
LKWPWPYAQWESVFWKEADLARPPFFSLLEENGLSLLIGYIKGLIRRTGKVLSTGGNGSNRHGSGRTATGDLAATNCGGSDTIE